MPSCLRAEEVGRTRPRAVAVTGCILHMSWSPCVHARVPSMCPRHAQGRAMVAPWCGQGFPLVLPPLSHLSPLKEQYGSFSLFLEETSICLRRHNGIINKYKLKFQKFLNLHLHHLSLVHVRCPYGVHVVHVWLARNARSRCASDPLAVRVWLARDLLT